MSAGRDVNLRVLHKVAIDSVAVHRGESMGGLQLPQRIAPNPNETIGLLQEEWSGIKSAVDGYCISAVGGVRGRDRVRSEQDVVHGRGVHCSRVGTAIAAATSTVSIDAGVVNHVQLIRVAVAYQRPEFLLHHDRSVCI